MRSRKILISTINRKFALRSSSPQIQHISKSNSQNFWNCEQILIRKLASILEKDISLFDQTSTGELISSISSDVQEVRLAIKHAVSMGVRSTTQVWIFSEFSL